MPNKPLPKLLRDQRGMETLEYALIAGLVALLALFIHVDAGWRRTAQNRLIDSTTAGDTSKDKPGNGQCPLPPCGQPKPCGTPPCGKDK